MDEQQAARHQLAASDHEVIRAMEKRLLAEGALPAEFGKRREALRRRVATRRDRSGVAQK